MVILRNVPFLIWFAKFLRTLKPIKKNIDKYRVEGDRERERAEIRKAEDMWAQALLGRMNISLAVKNAEIIPDGPVVFVSNHQSYWDIPIFFAAIKNKQFGFVAKDNLRMIPVFGSWIADIRSVFIKRNDVRASLRAIEEGVELLKQGYSLVIFPEGTRSKGMEMGEFKKGSLRLATKAKVPIIPITLKGTYCAYEEMGYVRSANVDFYIHHPIETKDLSRSDAANLAEHVEKIIKSGLA